MGSELVGDGLVLASRRLQAAASRVSTATTTASRTQAISSLYDFPTNDPELHGDRGRRLRLSGDIRYLGDPATASCRSADRTRSSCAATATWAVSLNVGGGINTSSGKPLDADGREPELWQQVRGEIPETARGAGIDTDRRLRDAHAVRKPGRHAGGLHAESCPRSRRVTLLADVFNLFNQRRVTSYDQNTQLDQRTGGPGLRQAD